MHHLRLEKAAAAALILIWGTIALVAAGLGVFVRMPAVMPRIAEIPQFSSVMPFVRFCFYFMGITLVLGGLRKLQRTRRSPE